MAEKRGLRQESPGRDAADEAAETESRKQEAGSELSRSEKPPRWSGSRAYARRRLAQSTPQIVEAFLEAARSGSNPHLRTLLEMCGMNKAGTETKPRKKKEKSLKEILTEHWKREAAEAAQGGESVAATQDREDEW